MSPAFQAGPGRVPAFGNLDMSQRGEINPLNSSGAMVMRILGWMAAAAVLAATAAEAAPKSAIRRVVTAPPPVVAAPPPAPVGPPQPRKAVVSVEQIEDLANTGQGAVLRQMIETAVSNSGKFRLMDTSENGMRVLLKEQADAKAGLRTTNTPGRVGGFEGVDYKVYGTITNAQTTARRNVAASTGMLAGGVLARGLLGNNAFGNAAAVGLIANSDCRSAAANIAVDLKIVDQNTSEIRYTKHVTQTQQSGTSCGSGNPQLDLAALMRTASQRAAGGLIGISYPMKVVQMQADGQAILNYGEGIVFPGDLLAVFQQGQAIKDPDTGAILGNEEAMLGLMRVAEVLPKMSKAQLVTPFAAPPPSGAIAREPTPAQEALLVKTAAPRRR